MVTDTQRWAAFTRTPWSETAPAMRESYVPSGRREVAAIAARIAGATAIVLTFTVGLGYLIVRVLAS